MVLVADGGGGGPPRVPPAPGFYVDRFNHD